MFQVFCWYQLAIIRKEKNNFLQKRKLDELNEQATFHNAQFNLTSSQELGFKNREPAAHIAIPSQPH